MIDQGWLQGLVQPKDPDPEREGKLTWVRRSYREGLLGPWRGGYFRAGAYLRKQARQGRTR